MYWYVILKRTSSTVNNASVSIIYDFSVDSETGMEYERLKATARTPPMEESTWKCHSTSRHKSFILDEFLINFSSMIILHRKFYFFSWNIVSYVTDTFFIHFSKGAILS